MRIEMVKMTVVKEMKMVMMLVVVGEVVVGLGGVVVWKLMKMMNIVIADVGSKPSENSG